MDARAIIGIDHVAGSAAARAIVAGMVVRAEEIQRRVQQAGLLQTDEHGIGAVLRAKAAVAEARENRPAVFVLPVRVADIGSKLAAALKDTKNVAGLGHLK